MYKHFYRILQLDTRKTEFYHMGMLLNPAILFNSCFKQSKCVWVLLKYLHCQEASHG